MEKHVGLNLYSARRRAGLSAPGYLSSLSYLSALVLFVFLVSGCSTMKPMESQLASEPQYVDGALTEWSGAMQPVGGNALRMGVRHDDEFVYVSLQTIDELMLRRILLGGLTLWFNTEGNRSREIGIRYPLSLSREAPLEVTDDFSPTTRNLQPARLSTLELTDAAGNAASWPIDGVPGLEVKSFLEYGSFSYELKIPIRPGPGKQLSISPGPENVFGLGIETGEINMVGQPNSALSTDMAAPSGGRRGRRGGGGATSLSRSAGPSGGLEPFETWMTISLGSSSAESN